MKNMAVPPPRETWISKVGAIDEIHRSFSWVVFIAGVVVFYLARWRSGIGSIQKIGSAVFGVILLQIATGIGLYYLGMPPAYQVVHLVGIAFMLGLEFLQLLLVMNAETTPLEV